MEKVEGIIVGQGLAGTLLAYELSLRDKKVVIIDADEEQTSSKIAAGIYNPITGRKMVKTWLADEMFPPLPKYYQRLEQLTGSRFLHPISIYRPFAAAEEQNDWQTKAHDSQHRAYISKLHQKHAGIEGIRDEAGGLMLNVSGYVDLPTCLRAMREFFLAKGMLHTELFLHDKLTVSSNEVRYGDVEANWIVFCEGPKVMDNPFFRSLRFRPVKGELIGIQTGKELKHIVNRGVFMIPKRDFVQVGSTYDHQKLDWEPSERGVQQLQDRLRKLFSGQYEIVNRQAGVRPATFDRRPYVGMLQKTPRIGIFNGLGTKGVSLGPHFAQLMTKHLIDGTPLPEEVSIER
ncbi:MAG: FAD-binding oxidoreductase [Bacteroidota bacterium]